MYPVLFRMYTAELFDVIADCEFTAHSYTPTGAREGRVKGSADSQMTLIFVLCLITSAFVICIYRSFLPNHSVNSSSHSVNGDIAIQLEWSNFDPSQNPNPLTDYDKTLHLSLIHI